MDIKLIKPKVKGESDKYSWQLYEYIKKHPSHVRVYWNNHSGFDGQIIEFSPNHINKRSQIIIGIMNENLIGNSLGSIMGQNKNKYQSWCFHPIGGWKNEQFEDITEWFWKNYIKLGRCLFDKNHGGWWTNDENRFTTINNTRKCNWCGQWQNKVIHKKIKIERQVKWINE